MDGERREFVVVASATGVKASYYHRYAVFLAASGFRAITFDYRGIGQSRCSSLRGLKARWYDWAVKDIDAVLGWALANGAQGQLFTVGHSFGGFGIGLARNSRHVSRSLTVGAQHAYWQDYRPGHRLRLWWRWHLAMPAMTLWNGYFPGKKLGWLEDLPRGVALDWARSPKDFTAAAPRGIRQELQEHRLSFTAPSLALAAADDPFATPSASARALRYYPNSPAAAVELSPEQLGEQATGHFGLFHSRFRDSFWPGTVAWLRHGENPWA